MEIYKDHLFVEMYSEYEGHLHGFKRVLLEGKTNFQKIEIVDTYEYGRCLLLDGMMQSSQADEFLYHEFLVHPALITHPDPKRILIVGGGEGASLREVLRYSKVEKVDMIEIDAKVLEFARQHLQEWHQGAFDDPRVQLMVGDGRQYLQEVKQAYDIILLDVSDPSYAGPACLLYTLQFYRNLALKLRPQGILVQQAGSSSVTHGDIMASVYQTMKQVFSKVRGYESNIPSFDMPWGFCFASQHWDPRELSAKIVDQRLAQRGIAPLRAYDGETHIGLFHISKALRTLLETQGRIIEDTEPIYTPR